uniref:PSI-K n=1 Tax=Cyanidiococcus yangmingshanensis TaxID=2690220 RepID=A0A7G5VUX6_9RHOD|nr:photosystem I reaction center subunit X [Cyanidiococcus yangmingshanensis]QMX77493.1 photosystem I reaction center subunit X [Cyanidiococcus yangmingshanensis]UNJ15909.1 photosystem I subunit X [Cyanidioschyzonaceae sp. 3]WDB00402.1 photosystem I subunit X [Cyanidiococcus yangmingshanensis]
MIQFPSSIPVIMVISNLLALAIGRYAIQNPSNETPIIGLNLAQLVATTSFGHIIGVATILGLSNMGII